MKTFLKVLVTIILVVAILFAVKAFMNGLTPAEAVENVKEFVSTMFSRPTPEVRYIEVTPVPTAQTTQNGLVLMPVANSVTAEKAEAEAAARIAEAEAAKAEAEAAKAEAEQAKAEAEQAKAEAEQAKAEAERAKAEQAKAEEVISSQDLSMRAIVENRVEPGRIQERMMTWEYFQAHQDEYTLADDLWGIKYEGYFYLGNSIGPVGYIKTREAVADNTYFSALYPNVEEFARYFSGNLLKYSDGRGPIIREGYTYTKDTKLAFVAQSLMGSVRPMFSVNRTNHNEVYLLVAGGMPAVASSVKEEKVTKAPTVEPTQAPTQAPTATPAPVTAKPTATLDLATPTPKVTAKPTLDLATPKVTAKPTERPASEEEKDDFSKKREEEQAKATYAPIATEKPVHSETGSAPAPAVESQPAEQQSPVHSDGQQNQESRKSLSLEEESSKENVSVTTTTETTETESTKSGRKSLSLADEDEAQAESAKHSD